MSLAEELKAGAKSLADLELDKLRARDEARKQYEAESRGPVPTILAYRADELSTVVFPPRKPILTREGQPFFSCGEIGEIFSTRGIGKTWLLMTMALMVSNGKSLLGFTVPERRRVLYIDGEMSRQDIQERFAKLCDRTKLKMTDHLVFIAADWQPEYLPRIDTLEGQQVIEPFVEPAELVIFDNRSCLFDSEGEKDPTAWQPTQDYLLSLRRRDKGSLIAHHANRQGGARGLGKPEDVMNLVMKLSHPDDYKAEEGARFICDVTPPDGKARGIYGSAAVPFCLRWTPTGWLVEAVGRDFALRQQILDYLTLADQADDRPKSANAALGKIQCNRAKGLKVWGEMLSNGEIVGDKKTGYKAGVVKASPY